VTPDADETEEGGSLAGQVSCDVGEAALQSLQAIDYPRRMLTERYTVRCCNLDDSDNTSALE
jgi:hypothetical protein